MKRLSNVDWWKLAHFAVSVLAFVVCFGSFFKFAVDFSGTPGAVAQTYSDFSLMLSFDFTGGSDFFTPSATAFGGWLMPLSALCKYLMETASIGSNVQALAVWRVVCAFGYGFDCVLWCNLFLLVLHVVLFIPFATYHFFRRD